MNSPIAWFVRNPVAANLLMVAIGLAGIFTLVKGRIPLEVFPEFEARDISIRVPFRGGTAEEVEESVVVRVEEAIQDVRGVRRIVSTATETGATITVEIDERADPREVLEDLKAQVDSLSTLPEQAERPLVTLADPYQTVITVIVSGPLDEDGLRTLGQTLRDEIAQLPRVSAAELQGVRPYEISLEVTEETLQGYGLTLGEVAAAIRAAAVDLPAGTLRTPGGEVVVRSRGRAYTGEDFGRLLVKVGGDGSRLTVADLARVRDGFDEEPFVARFNGERAVMIAVFRRGEENAIEVADAVKAEVERLRAGMPEGVKLQYWQDRSKIVKARLTTLLDSARLSIVLVSIVLALFLRPSLAFWVILGMPLSFLGAIALMPELGVTINLVSLFGFILVLGIVVDDAIVTGENVHHLQEQGVPWEEAAIRGTREIALPVTFGILTTMLAFVPLMLDPSSRGRWLSEIGVIVIAVLAFSLVESKLILPAHLAHDVGGRMRGLAEWLVGAVVCRLVGWVLFPLLWLLRVLRAGAGGAMTFLVERIYTPVFHAALGWRYPVLTLFLAMLLVAWGLVAGGRIGTVAFPRIPSERVTARLTMEEGTPYEITEEHVLRIEAEAMAMVEKYRAPDGSSMIEGIITSIGGQGISSSRRRGSSGQGHLGEVTFETVAPERRSGDFRELDTGLLSREWRERIGSVPGARELSFRAQIGRRSSDFDIQLTGQNIRDLEEVAALAMEKLASFEGVSDVATSQGAARDELELRLKPEAEQAGLTMIDLARQVRQAFFGEEVQRIQRGRDEVRVMLRYPEEDRKSVAVLERMRIRTPDGGEVPFGSVAEVTFSKSQPLIRRVDRARALNLSASLDTDNPRLDVEEVQRQMGIFLEGMKRRYPGLSYSYEGDLREAAESRAAALLGVLVVAFGIYAMLAIPLRSFTQPLIVMSVLPFALIGAAAGHLIMGQPISMMSQFGMLALAGVVVNDSLVLVDFINRRIAAGDGIWQAVKAAGPRRFRAILLTSLTTMVGLAPLLLEKSTQAQMLIPMAISLAYGIAFATLVTLFLVPVLYVIGHDLRRWAGWSPGGTQTRPSLGHSGAARDGGG
jgi:multidrug efflux pump subunit AcrB